MAQSKPRTLKSGSTDLDSRNSNVLGTPKKTERKSFRTKLSKDSIAECLDESDSEVEFETPRNIKRNGKIENSSIPACNDSPKKIPIIIKICIKKVKNKSKYSINNAGKNENKSKPIPKENKSAVDRSRRHTLSVSSLPKANDNRRSTRHKPLVNYNEDNLFKQSQNISLQKNEFESIKRSTKRNKTINEKKVSDNEKCNEDEIDEIVMDENDMDNANAASPSKRKKVADIGWRTPPSSLFNDLTINTPKSLPKYQKNRTTCSKRLMEDSKPLLNVNNTDSKKQKKNVSSYNDFDLPNMSDRESESCDDNDEDYINESQETSSDTSESISSDADDEMYNSRNTHNRNSRPKTSSNLLKTPSKKTEKVSMDTPIKKFSRLSLTPSVHKRVSNIAKPTTPLQQARQKLHVGILPKSLPCREGQFNDIYIFLKTRLSDNTGGCYYISGVPGTGKTATVSEVIRSLKKAVAKEDIPEFDFVDINGMKLAEPRQAYTQIWKQLTGESRTWEDAQKMLHDRFSKNKSKKMTLLLVDELDMLCTKRQDVVYNLLDWPSKKNAKLIVVTIANTMDLPERILMGKVTSRLGLTRLTFPPYNYKQLKEIVISRLKNPEDAFDNDIIQLVARKIAAVSGDARRALDICRRSTEVAEVNGRETVTLPDVMQALDEMIASPKIQAIKHCSTMEKYFLKAVCTEVQRTGFEEVVFENVYYHMKTIVATEGLKEPNVTQALFICARLGSYRLLLTEHSRQDIHQRITLNVSADDVDLGLKNEL